MWEQATQEVQIYICLPIYLGLSISLACYKILTKPRPGHCPVRGGGDWGGSLPALVGNNRVYGGGGIIHSKSWIRWIQKSADDFEFSAERLSKNMKSIKITLVTELLTVISTIYVQSLQ